MAEKKELTKRRSASDVKIDSSVKIQRIDATKNGTFKCTCCGKEYSKQAGNFPSSNSILFAGNGGYITICRDCVERYFMQLIGYYSGNDEHAMERCCQLFDWYYNTDITALARDRKNEKGYSMLSSYASKMNMAQFKNKGTTYMDTVKDRASEKIMKIEDLQTIDEVGEAMDDEPTSNISIETIKFFGYGYTNEEYEYLEEQYGDWCARYECKTKAQEELFKSLCVAQLSIQRAQKKGNAKEVNDTMRTFQDLLGTANIKPNQTNDNALAEQNSFGTLIKKWENERPICEPDKEWQDVDKIHEYIDTYFLGHLCNLVHVKNDKEEAYRREMDKYTVRPPVYEEDDSAGETSLLDKFSDKGDSKNDSDE